PATMGWDTLPTGPGMESAVDNPPTISSILPSDRPRITPRPVAVGPPVRMGRDRQRDDSIPLYQKGYNIPSPSDHDRTWLRAPHQPGWGSRTDRAGWSAGKIGEGRFDGPGSDLSMALQFNACRRNTVAARDRIVSPGLPILAGSSPILIRPGVPFPTRA